MLPRIASSSSAGLFLLRAASTTASSSKSSTSSSSSSSSNAPGQEEQQRARRNIVRIKKSGSATFKEFVPITSSIRQRRVPLSPHLHKGRPVRALTVAKRSSGGRNNSGRITVRARGGGHKRRIRLVDFVRLEQGEQDVVRIEYDPGRSAHIALLQHKETNAQSYIIAPEGLRAGHVVSSFRSGLPAAFTTSTASSSTARVQVASSPEEPQTVKPPFAPSATDESVPQSSPETSSTEAVSTVRSESSSSSSAAPDQVPPSIDLGMLRSLALKPGNLLPVRYIPVGTVVHAITLSRSGPAVLARSAGSSARIISAASPSGKHAQVRLSSGEVRYVGLDCFATVGSVSNPDHQHENFAKAGRMRWLGFRPQSRGVAMNSCVH